MIPRFKEGDRVLFDAAAIGDRRVWVVVGVRDNTIDGPQHLLLKPEGGGRFDTYPWWVSSSLVLPVAARRKTPPLRRARR